MMVGANNCRTVRRKSETRFTGLGFLGLHPKSWLFEFRELCLVHSRQLGQLCWVLQALAGGFVASKNIIIGNTAPWHNLQPQLALCGAMIKGQCGANAQLVGGDDDMAMAMVMMIW